LNNTDRQRPPVSLPLPQVKDDIIIMPASRQTRSTSPGAVYAVCGPEAFLKRETITKLTDEILGSADRALALSEYDGSSASVELADVLDDLRTLPFLTARRLVRVIEADAFITRYRSELEDYTENPSATGVLLLECKSLPANTRLYKRISAAGEVIKCEPVTARTVPGWLSARAREIYGKRLDPRAAALLCDQIGTDLGLLDAELQKLSLYVGQGRQITTADVEDLSGRCREEQVWGILSAIAAGNTARALELWEEVWQTDRAASARAIGGIAFTVRRLLNAKRDQEAGVGIDQLRKTMMIWRDDRRLQAELSAFTSHQVELMLCKLLEADVAAKTGQVSVRSSIEAFIVELCQRRRPRQATG